MSSYPAHPSPRSTVKQDSPEAGKGEYGISVCALHTARRSPLVMWITLWISTYLQVFAHMSPKPPSFWTNGGSCLKSGSASLCMKSTRLCGDRHQVAKSCSCVQFFGKQGYSRKW